MRCEQAITGAVNNGSCVVGTGLIGEQGFIVYTSGSAVVILTPELGFVQKIEGKALGYDVQSALCVTSSEDCGRIAAAWGRDVCVFEPECLNSAERLAFPKAFLYKWKKITSLKASSEVKCISFDKPGDRLLTGGQHLQLWMVTTPDLSISEGVVNLQREPSPLAAPPGQHEAKPEWTCTWKKELSVAAELMHFSPDGQLFATAGNCDRAVKIWYEIKNSLYGVMAAPLDFTFTYVSHPRQVSSFSWRQTSPLLPGGVICNVLLTRCHDNVCRVWAQTPCHQDHYDQSQPPHHAPTNTAPEGSNIFTPPPSGGMAQPSACYKVGASLHFNLAGSIDPGSNIPMHSSSSSPAGHQKTSLFTVHWMDNKNLCLQFAAKAMKSKEAAHTGHSGRSSPSSIASEDSLVIVNGPEQSEQNSASSTKASSAVQSPVRSPLGSHYGEHLDVPDRARQLLRDRGSTAGLGLPERPRSETFMSSGNWVVVPADSSPGQWVVIPFTAHCGDESAPNANGLSSKAVGALLHEWRNTPDMLFAIHPYDGSLLVWMMDGLDAVSPSFRLARLSFASRIPHAMPTADVWTLQGNIFTMAGAGPDDSEDIGKLLATPAKRHTVLSGSISGRSTPSAWMRRRRSDGSHHSNLMHRGMTGGGPATRLPSVLSSPDMAHPSLSLVSHHIGGAMHVWSVEFGRGSCYLTPFAMHRVGSAVGHRLPCRASLVHPSSSLLLTAAHVQENVPTKDEESAVAMSSRASELILWQMHAPGRCESGEDVLQLVSVLHSSNHAAFRRQCWIDSKLALTTSELAKPVTLGSVPTVTRVGPSALFISQNDEGVLSIFQVITDAVQWLAVHGGAVNTVAKLVVDCGKRRRELSTSLDSDATTPGSPAITAMSKLNTTAGSPGVPAVMELGRGEIISRQCGARPGCVLHLGELCDVDLIPGEVVLLHSFRLTDSWIEAIQSGTGTTLQSDVVNNDGGQDDDEFLADANKPLVSEETENFLVVAIENRTSLISELSTPMHGASGLNAESKASPASFLHTWLVSIRRHAVVLSVHTKLEDRVYPPVVEVLTRSLAVQQLSLAPDAYVTSATVSIDQACAMSLDGVSAPPPWQIVTVSSDHTVQSWQCTGRSADLLHDLDSAEDHLEGHALGDTDSPDLILSSLQVKWDQVFRPAPDAAGDSSVLAVSAASPSQIVALCCKGEEEECGVQVWDSSASGGHAWHQEDLDITVPGEPNSSRSPVLPLWMPQHDGSNLLAVSQGSRMSVMQCQHHLPGQSKAMWQNVSTTEVASVHDMLPVSRGESPEDQLTEVPRATNECCIAAGGGQTQSLLPLAWCRGNLVLGYNNGSVMLVLSHWLATDDSYSSAQTTCMSVGPVKDGDEDLESSLPAAHTASSASFRAADPAKEESRKSLLRVGGHGGNSPHLPQYHPDQLSQLLHAGRLRRVRSILTHLVQCLARRALAERFLDEHSHPDEERWLNSWWRPSGSGDKYVISDILPLSLSQLLSQDTQLREAPSLPSSQSTGTAPIPEEKEEAVTNNDYDQLFGTNTDELKLELELDLNFNEENKEVDDSAEEIKLEREHLCAATFGASQFDFLTSYLSKVRLCGLTSLEQMRLLALAQTVATTHHLFDSESSSDAANEAAGPAGKQLLGTGGAGGAGYASRAEGGEEGIDDCGVRFLLSMRQYTGLLHSVPMKQRAALMGQGLSTAALAWAFHSHAEEELLSLVPCVQSGRISWTELRAVGVGWWLRSQESLRRLAEKLAKAQFSVNQDPMDAALLYLAMKKQSLLRAMFRNARDDRMSSFFANDFKEERWRKAALKNAFVLLGKQRLEQAAAFFLLGGALDDCIEVCLHRLHDLQLALVVCRLFEGLGESGPKYQGLLRKTILDVNAVSVRQMPTPSSRTSTPKHSAPATSTKFGSNTSFGLSAGLRRDKVAADYHVAPCQDPFLRSLAHWILQDYGMAMDTLLESLDSPSVSLSSPDADVTLFNFYFFLREHPLLLRRQYSQAQAPSQPSGRFNLMGGGASAASTATPVVNKPCISGVGSDPLTDAERKLLFQTAHAHMQQGRLLLVLDVLSHLPATEADSVPLSPNGCEGATTDSATDTADSSAPVSKAADTADSFDWSAPVTKAADTADSFDWSAPASKAADTVDSFDWGAPSGLQSNLLDEEYTPTDWSKPVSSTDGNLSDNEADGQGDTASLQTPTPPPSNIKKPTVQTTTYSVTQWSASSLRWRAVLNLLLEELQTASTHVLESGFADEFLYLHDEKVRRSAWATDEMATPTSSFTAGAVADSNKTSSAFKPVQCLRTMELRRFVWSLLVEELSVWSELSGMRAALNPVQKDSLLRALHGLAPRHQGDQLVDYSLKWIRDHYTVLASLWRYFDLHSAVCPPLQSILLEVGALLQRPQPPALSVVHEASVAMFQTDVAVNEQALSPRQILLEMANLLPQSMPPFLLSASPLPSHTLWSPLSDVRNIARQIFSILLDCPDLPSCNNYFDNKVVEHLTQLCGVLSMSIVQTLVTVDHSLSPKSLSHLSSGHCSPFAFSLAHHMVMGSFAHGSRSASPPDFIVTRDATPVLGQSPAPANASATSRKAIAQPSQWPGLRGWPRTLASTDWCITRCSDKASLSLLLGEACVAVYVGMVAVSLAKLSARRLLCLLKNMPGEKLWHAAFGGGYRMSTGSESASSVGSVMHDHHQVRRGSLQRKVGDSVNAATKRLLHTPGGTGRDSAGSARSDGGTRRPKIVDVFMFPALTMDEYFRSANEDNSAPVAVQEVAKPEEARKAERKFVYDGDNLSDFDDDEASLPSWSDPKSAGWTLLQMSALHLLADGLKTFLPLVGVELAELPLWSPSVYNTFCQLDSWQMQAFDLFHQSPDDLRKTMFSDNQFHATDSLDIGGSTPGPALLQHKALLEPNCTPFSNGIDSNSSSVACEQLWQYLVKQEKIRDIFIDALFTEEAPASSSSPMRKRESACLVYKEPDVITSIAVNQANQVQMVVATSREVVEIDTSFLQDSSRQLWTDDEDDGSGHRLSRKSHDHSTEDFLMVHSVPGLNDWSSRNSSPDLSQSQSGTGAILLMRRGVSGVRHVECHPTVPYYLCGSEDGSVRLWEFGRNRAISSHRNARSAPCVTKLHFTSHGNKFAASDVSGNVALWQFGSTSASSDPYAEIRCHNRSTNDFVFMKSSSFIATAGHSADGKNVALYDFLVPPQKALIKGFHCHDGGASSVIYAPSHHLIISAGKKGDICVFDVRQRALLQSVPAHNDAIKTLAMADNEEFFASGGADGAVKLWDVAIPRQRSCFVDEHVRSSFFRSAGSGVQHIALLGHSQLFSCGADGLVKSRML